MRNDRPVPAKGRKNGEPCGNGEPRFRRLTTKDNHTQTLTSKEFKRFWLTWLTFFLPLREREYMCVTPATAYSRGRIDAFEVNRLTISRFTLVFKYFGVVNLVRDWLTMASRITTNADLEVAYVH